MCTVTLLLYTDFSLLVAGILHEALNWVTTSDAVHMMSGAEGRRRHAVYSKCFTPSTINSHYAVYNQVNYVSIIYHIYHASVFATAIL